MPKTHPLLRQVMATIEAHAMLAGGDTVVVAVSGGPDSVVLLDVLHQLAPHYRLTLHVAHLNHLLRPEAAQDARFVRSRARRLGLPFHETAVDVRALARERKMSEEEAGREARYALLNEVADRVGATRVAVGHHADDQAETVLINLLRGAGIDGLAGIPPVRGRIIRPLLALRREEIEAYRRSRRLSARVDATNEDPGYLRNRIRHTLLPLLEREYQGNLRDGLVRVANLAREDSRLLHDEAKRAWRRCRVAPREGRIELSSTALSRLPLALQRRVLREAVREAAGGLANIDFSHVESLLAFALTAQTGKQLDLPLGVRAMKEPGRVVLTIVPQSSPSPFEVAAIIPGVTELPDGSMLIATVILRAEIGDLRQDAGGAVAHLDFARLQTPLTVRSWNRGDRFHPLGAPGTTKLHDFFVNNKVPREQRLRVPLLVSDGRIAWVAGHRIDDRFKVTARTRTVSRIELRPGLHPHPERTGT